MIQLLSHLLHSVITQSEAQTITLRVSREF